MDQLTCDSLSPTDYWYEVGMLKIPALVPPWEDQCEWRRMTGMAGPDCAVMCNLINTHTHIHTHTYILQ